MTNVNDPDPHDDVLAAAWRSQSEDQPPPALDATILAAAHRAVGSGPRGASAHAREATRPQRWWMPLAAAATIGVVVIGILQVAPQAPFDTVIGERADFPERAARKAEAPSVAPPVSSNATAPVVTPPGPAVEQAPAPSPTRESVPVPAISPTPPVAVAVPAPVPAISPTSPVAVAVPAPVPAIPPTPPVNVAVPPPVPAAPAPQKQAMVAESAPAPRAAEPQPFPADAGAKKLEADSASRQDERKDAAEVSRNAGVNSGAAGGVATAPPPPAAPAMAQRAQAAAAPPAALGKLDGRMRENSAARDEATTSSAPAAASPRQAPSELSAAELQQRARDPEAWIAEIRALRNSGRIAEATAQMREFRRDVPDAATRLPADLRAWYPRPATP